MSSIKKLLSRASALFYVWNKNKKNSGLLEIEQQELIKVHKEHIGRKCSNELKYIPGLGIRVALSYNTSKEILLNDSFRVSKMHTTLNKIYFQENSDFHSNNKKAAIKHLNFLSKNKLQGNNSYLLNLMDLFMSNIAKSQTVDIIYSFINPVVLINALNELGLLQVLTSLDPNHPSFDINKAKEQAHKIYSNRSNLEIMIRDSLTNENFPELVRSMLHDFKTAEEYDLHEMPFFLTTVVYTSIENVASFISSLCYYALGSHESIIKTSDYVLFTKLSDEVLRIHSPNFVTFRKAYSDTHINGNRIYEGETIGIFIGVANHDSQIFSNPKEIKLDRTANHLAFGRGQISCIGQHYSYQLAYEIIRFIHKHSFTIDSSHEPDFVVEGVVRLKQLFIHVRNEK